MKNLLKINTEAEFLSEKKTIEQPWVVQTMDDDAVHYCDDPFFKIRMVSEYDDRILIPLVDKKRDIIEETEWSCNLDESVAKVDGSTLLFLQHYDGPVTLNATAGDYSDEKIIRIKCSKEPDMIYRTIVTPPEVKTVEYNSTNIELSFVGHILATSDDGHLREETESTYHFIAECPEIPIKYPEVNTEMVDLGLPSGKKWAKCNLFAQKETESGYYFQWGDTNGFASAGDKGTIERTGVYLWNGAEVDWKVNQTNPHKTFDFKTTPFQTILTEDEQLTRFTKYLSSVDSPYKDPDATNEDALKTILDPKDDAVTKYMGEGWSLPVFADFAELINNTNKWLANIDGVDGFLFENKNDENKYIFFPFAGYYDKDNKEMYGEWGAIWINRVYEYMPFAAYFLDINIRGNLRANVQARRLGMPIRGIYNPNK